MLCAKVNELGQVVIIQPQPDNFTTCSLVIPSSGDLSLSPMVISSEDGLAIANAIVMVWCIGFAYRALISIVKINQERIQDD